MARDPSKWDVSKGASKLNNVRDDVISAFRSGLALHKIGKLYDMSTNGVRKWLVSQGEYDREVKCALLECDIKFKFSPKKLYCCRKHTKRADARNQSQKKSNRSKIRARSAVTRALRDGKIVRPDKCSRCD